MEKPAHPETPESRSADMRRSAQAVERSTGESPTAPIDGRNLQVTEPCWPPSEPMLPGCGQPSHHLPAASGKGIGQGILPAWVGQVSGSILILFAGFCLVAGVWREVHVFLAGPRPRIEAGAASSSRRHECPVAARRGCRADRHLGQLTAHPKRINDFNGHSHKNAVFAPLQINPGLADLLEIALAIVSACYGRFAAI